MGHRVRDAGRWKTAAIGRWTTEGWKDDGRPLRSDDGSPLRSDEGRPLRSDEGRISAGCQRSEVGGLKDWRADDG